MNSSIRSAFTRAGLAAVLLTSHLAAADVVRVACVGDSITFGYGLHRTYPAELGRWLGTNYDVRNFGVSATTLLHRGDFPYIGRPAYTNALDFKADIVVIDFGANDSKHPNLRPTSRWPKVFHSTCGPAQTLRPATTFIRLCRTRKPPCCQPKEA